MKPEMILVIVAAYILGELLQWAAWMKGHPAEPRSNYLRVGVPHWLTNIGVVVVVAVAWMSGMLAKGLEFMGASMLTQFVSETEAFGFMLILFADLYGDRLAYAFRDKLERRLFFLFTPRTDEPVAVTIPAATPPTPSTVVIIPEPADKEVPKP